MPATRDGAAGWDDYAPFYDWENARTVARRDVGFWQRLALAQTGPVLELGCGTGRIAVPVARTGADLVGIDRSAPMLAKARTRLRRAGLADRVLLVRGDIRALPFRRRRPFSLVMAPYGMLQSLTREADLTATLASVHSVVGPRGLLAVDLRSGPAAMVRIQQAGQPPGPSWIDPADARGVCQAGSQTRPDALRAGVRGASRTSAPGPPVWSDVPDAVCAADGAPPRGCRVRHRRRPRRLRRWPVG